MPGGQKALSCSVAWNSIPQVALLPFHRCGSGHCPAPRRAQPSARTMTVERGVLARTCPELRAWFVEGVGNRALEAQRGPFTGGGVPRVGSVARAGGSKNAASSLASTGVLGLAVAMRAAAPTEPRGAVEVVADCGDRGEAAQPFGREGQDDEFAAQSELLAERLAAASVSPVSRRPARSCRAAASAGGDCRVRDDRDRAVEEVLGVTIAAHAQRLVGGGGEQVRELVNVADLVKQRGGPVDALAKVGGAAAQRSPSRTAAIAIVQSSPAALAQRERLVGERRRRHRAGRRCPRATARSGGLARGSPGPPSALAIASASAMTAGCSAPRPSGHRAGLDAQPDAQRRMGVGARQAQRAVDPFDRVAIAISDRPVPAERRAHRERRFGAGLADRPAKGGVEVVDLGVEPARCSLRPVPQSARSVPWRWASARK